MAFFPGLPVLLSLFAQIGVPMAVSGVIISTLCSAVAAAALYRLGGPWAAVAWLFAPTAVFTTVPYTESLFCAAAFWAWERARSDRWLAAAVLASIACTVRVSGRLPGRCAAGHDHQRPDRLARQDQQSAA